ncbi:MAG: hypothetical protein RR506_08710, partial [Akkermansia sp.]
EMLISNLPLEKKATNKNTQLLAKHRQTFILGNHFRNPAKMVLLILLLFTSPLQASPQWSVLF